MESTPKQKVADPAARPSRPSVRLTAFDVATMTIAARRNQPADVRLHPGSEKRVKDRSVDVCTQ